MLRSNYVVEFSNEKRKEEEMKSLISVLVKYILIPAVAIVILVYAVPSFYATFKIKMAERSYAVAQETGDQSKYRAACKNYLAAYRKHAASFGTVDIHRTKDACNQSGNARDAGKAMLLTVADA